MKKEEVELFGLLLLLGAVAYPFFWLYETLGPVGLGLVFIACVALFLAWKKRQTNKQQKAFEDLVLYVLNNRLHPDEAKTINKQLVKIHFDWSALIRNLQIIRDSIEIALASKKRATAESRRDVLLDRFADINHSQSHLISESVFTEIEQVVNDFLKALPARLALNEAKALMDKSRTLKTEKSRKKYLGLAIESLEQGVAEGGFIEDVAKLRDLLDNLHQSNCD